MLQKGAGGPRDIRRAKSLHERAITSKCTARVAIIAASHYNLAVFYYADFSRGYLVTDRSLRFSKSTECDLGKARFHMQEAIRVKKFGLTVMGPGNNEGCD